ncbi:biotin--[acetyl-CoA-carboxylase] ligase [Mechercharimyces sp. CAU 1602]|uniref:biotin--[acetyl-CoA-carboxylase] ligase n=1 Tax=Mechercharimyces sp. CAU 1602 TaxID=2973933 RepID=UPI002163B2E1|nr:biotin--[acetyl-CoA-carboxylase] ligase [Mechercharimyces sp. CAU 1602]MCS1351013.1 biotin--[acetyl-CoA-carboxylase] ligase [Mechercharimyces sp. CAU 1602]
MPKPIRDHLLQVLLDRSSDYLSGTALSSQLGCSRTAIWKHINELRADGYEIEARPNQGYRLCNQPDRMEAAEIKALLHTKSFGQSIRYYSSLDSTQTAAHQWARSGAEEGALVVAEEQTAGRGRLGRSWHSPAQTGIWMSLILRPPIPLTLAPQLTLLASVAVAQGIEQATGVSASIKWPNDLLLEGKKVCGILTELRGEQDQIDYVILGIGINAKGVTHEWPEEIRERATILPTTKRKWRRAELTALILYSLEMLYQQYMDEGFAPIRTQWEARSSMLGERINARTGKGFVEGIACGLNDHGALVVTTSEGEQHLLYSAEIERQA